jgi:hypothetical protein
MCRRRGYRERRKRRGLRISDSLDGPLGTKVPAFEEVASSSSVFLKLKA